MDKIAVIGTGGAIGNAIAETAATRFPSASIFAFSRTSKKFDAPNINSFPIDYVDETSIETAAKHGPFCMVLITTGILHDGAVMPEKSLADLDAQTAQLLFTANTITPMLLAKQFLPQLSTRNPARCGILSARVGSISDNRLGGWYSYRASKAALNMVIKTASIELRRRNPGALIVGLHPGTVDSNLSKPFQARVPEGKLFTPTYSASCLLDVLTGLKPRHSGHCFAWDGQEIAP